MIVATLNVRMESSFSHQLKLWIDCVCSQDCSRSGVSPHGLTRTSLIEKTRPPVNVSSTIQSPLEYTNRFAPKMGQKG